MAIESHPLPPSAKRERGKVLHGRFAIWADDCWVSERIRKLGEAIETTHECNAVHVGTEIVVEFFRDSVAWNGLVEIFDLKGHPKAKRCYAWSYPVTDDTQCVTVLEIAPIDSAESAVRVGHCEGPTALKNALRALTAFFTP